MSNEAKFRRVDTNDESEGLVLNRAVSRGVRREVLWCLAAHGGMVLFHGVLILVMLERWEHSIPLPSHLSSSTLSTAVTECASVFGTIVTSLLLVLTQRLALRRNILQRQTLSSLHDRTSSWLGLGAALNVLRRQRRFASRITLTALYLGLMFGVHTTIPALLNIVALDTETSVPARIVQMTPPVIPANESVPIPFRYLPAANDLRVLRPGISVNQIYDVFLPGSTPYTGNWTGPKDGMSAAVCATRFEPTCEVMAASNATASFDMGGSRKWDVILEDGWTARISPSIANPQYPYAHKEQVAQSMVRIVPAPSAEVVPQVPYVTLLATWNVTDANHTVHNTISIRNVSDVDGNSLDMDLTFLKCSLAWEVTTVFLGSHNNLTSNASSVSGECARSDALSSGVKIDSVNFNWTSIWTKVMSWPYKIDMVAGISVVDGTPNVAEDYFMSTLSSTWYWDDLDWGRTMPEGSVSFSEGLPNLQQITTRLGEMTATVFWLTAWQGGGNGSPPPDYEINAKQITQRPHINISRTPLIAGLVLSVLMTALAFVLFRGDEPGMRSISDAGVLELAWIFTREAGDFKPLLDIQAPKSDVLRTAGQQIMWKGVHEPEEWEMDEPQHAVA